MIGQYPKIYDAIRELVGGNLAGDTDSYESTQYLDGQTPPTKKQVEEKLAELQAEYDAQEYARNRASAYDSIGNQLDMIYKDNLNGTTTHKASVEAVKAKFPKPE